MNIFFQKALNLSRKIFLKIFNPKYVFEGRPRIVTNIEYGNKLIKEALNSNKPAMIARLGTTESGTAINYLGVKENKKNSIKYIFGMQHAWWWNRLAKITLLRNAGFFPTTDENLSRYGELVLHDLQFTDILISLTYYEEYLKPYFKTAKRITLPSAEPYFSINPWTHALAGKKVLVIHPMEQTIKNQYKIREKIWPDGLIPEFELMTLKAVQTVAGESSEFKDWFEALDWMKSEINKFDFDIAIIGCGAYGFHLAAHVKRLGKKAVHLGGATQLLFGIRGKRWEVDPTQPFTNFMNEFWVRPGQDETPKNANIVEGGCYW